MVVPPMQSISGNNNSTYTLYMVTPHSQYARFAMPAMFRASAAEVWWLLINSPDFGCVWSVTVISLAIPHLLIPGYLRFTWVGTGLGHLIPTWSVCWKCGEHPQLLSTTKLIIYSFGRRNIQLHCLWVCASNNLYNSYINTYSSALLNQWPMRNIKLSQTGIEPVTDGSLWGCEALLQSTALPTELSQDTLGYYPWWGLTSWPWVY